MRHTTLILLFALVIYAVGSALDIFSSLRFEHYGLHESNKLMRDKNGNFAEKKNTGFTIGIAFAAFLVWTLVTTEYRYSVSGGLAAVGLWRAGEAIRNWIKKSRSKKTTG